MKRELNSFEGIEDQTCVKGNSAEAFFLCWHHCIKIHCEPYQSCRRTDTQSTKWNRSKRERQKKKKLHKHFSNGWKWDESVGAHGKILCAHPLLLIGRCFFISFFFFSFLSLLIFLWMRSSLCKYVVNFR